jgi:hypothetical protein
MSARLEHLTLAWAPQESDGSLEGAIDAIHDAWRLPTLRALFVHRAPPPLGAAILRRAAVDGAKLRTVHLVDVPLPDQGSSFWQNLREFSFVHERGPRGTVG